MCYTDWAAIVLSKLLFDPNSLVSLKELSSEMRILSFGRGLTLSPWKTIRFSF